GMTKQAELLGMSGARGTSRRPGAGESAASLACARPSALVYIARIRGAGGLLKGAGAGGSLE
ncbi:hypothetical protein NHX12_020103, partial [Muraenolepis orangiensis]